MKLVGIVGSNAPFSYNRLLLDYIGYQFWSLFDLEILEIVNVPLFNQNDDQTDRPAIQNLAHKISAADGVIIATPEHNHTLTPALKSTLEWLSYQLHPFENKPVMIVGASYYIQGSSRAQLHLRQILDAPGVNAMVLPGNEFLLGDAKHAFDSHYHLKDPATVDFLESCLKNFVKYIKVTKTLTGKKVADEAEKQVDISPQTDATSAASVQDNKASTGKSPIPAFSSAQTPFEKALDEAFAPDLGLEGKDVLATIPLEG